MNPETLNWLFLGAQAFQADPKLTLWNGLSRTNFTLLLTSLFHTETLDEAVRQLEKIIAEGLTAPSVPPEMETLLKEWQKAQGEKEGIHQDVLKKVGAFLETQKKLAGTKRAVVLPLAQPITPPDKQGETLTSDQERTVVIQKFIGQFERSLQAKVKQDTEKARAAYQRSSQTVARSLINFPQQEITPKDYQELLTQTKTEVATQLKEAGIHLRPPQTRELIKELASQTLGEATTLVANTRPLPTSVVQQLVAAGEGVAFLPLYTLLEPTTAFSFLKKVALSPVVKTLQVVDKIAGGDLKGGAVKEWRELLHYGLTAEDVTASITAYREAGLPAEHPVLVKLGDVKERLQTYQQAHPRLTNMLKSYHEFTKKTGRRQIYLPETRTFLPRLSQPVAWVKKQGYAWQLRQVFNRVGLTLRTHEKVTLGVGTTIIRFAIPDTFVRVISFGKIANFGVVRTFFVTKVIRPVLTRLGGTIIGRGIKKAASWALKRLGLAAIPTGVTQVLAVGLIALDLLKKLFKNPAMLLALGATLVALPLLIVMAPIIATIATVAGLVMLGVSLVTAAAGFVSAAATAVASAITTAAATVATTITGAIGSLTAALTSATLPMIAVGTIGGVGALTMITLLNTSAAFVKKPSPNVGAPVPYGVCSITSDTTQSNALKELFINAGQWAGVPPAILAAVASIEGGQMFGYSDDQINSFSAPGAQDPTNCDPNGCGARGPMQFLNDGVAKDCGNFTNKRMPDQWAVYKDAVVKALPSERRTPEICNIKDSLYAAAWKIKTDSGAGPERSCSWTESITNKAAEGYFDDCTTPLPQLGGKTYCQYVWEYYQAHNLIQAPNPSGWFFWQGDPRWGSYSGSLPGSCRLANTGCGPTSMAMVFTFFGNNMLPPQMWDRFTQGHYLSCEGSSYLAFINVPRDAGLTTEDLGSNWGLAAQKLSEGKMIIASTRLYDGHFLVIREISGNTVTTNDPAVANGDGYPYTKTSILLLNLWAIGR